MFPGDVERALNLPSDEDVEQLKQLPENQWFERNQVMLHPADLVKPIVAMANAEGGDIAVGIHSGAVVPA